MDKLDILQYKDVLLEYLLRFLLSVCVLIFVKLFVRYFVRMVKAFLGRFFVNSALPDLLGDLLRYTIWILSIALIFKILGFTEISMILGGSILVVGVGVSRSITDIAGDLVSGIFLLIDEDIDAGKNAEIFGITGVITAIEVRKMKIRGEDGNLYIIPNRKIDRDVIIIHQSQ